MASDTDGLQFFSVAGELVWPIGGIADQSSTNWIITQIGPFISQGIHRSEANDRNSHPAIASKARRLTQTAYNTLRQTIA
jgi:hypothetical protein